ncbi:ICOS ligand-like isoform X2 [Sparus aurata]|uniref:ICOS ligand-like isoform X2 n=1 Tax=Sparus aurata TaxID=8175 RepID=UPI0011C14122|nr:ICOS ligand-like isoform X2 [Sparus aurata]
MSSTILLIVLLSAHITGLISEQLLKATVGGSVLFPCSLPGYPLSLNWFYWQEGDNLFFRWENGKEIEIKDNKYKGRFQVFTHEFSSGNISIRLDNISVEDDKNTFFTYVNLYDEQKKVTKQSQKQCIFTLQVSAPYQHLVLTVNHTTNSATCSARGGYPAAQVSWKGLNRSSDEEQDLQDAETFLQQDPTEKTFSFTSSVNVTGLKSVTCIVYNPHSNKTINKTMELVEINTADPHGVWITTPTFSTPSQDENGRHRFLIIAPFVLVILVIAGAVLFYLWYKKQRPVPGPVLVPLNPEPDVPNLQDAVQEEAPDLNPDAAREPVDPNPQDPVQEESQMFFVVAS